MAAETTSDGFWADCYGMGPAPGWSLRMTCPFDYAKLLYPQGIPPEPDASAKPAYPVPMTLLRTKRESVIKRHGCRARPRKPSPEYR